MKKHKGRYPLSVALHTMSCIRNNRGFGKTLHPSIIPIGSGTSVPSAVGVGEESGTSGDMLMKAATHVEEDTRRQIKRLLSMFEPLVIVGLALVVMTVVLAIFMAIMELNSVEM